MDIITMMLITNVKLVTLLVKLALLVLLLHVIVVGLGDSYSLILMIQPTNHVLIHVQ
jgi:hypothetical protein